MSGESVLALKVYIVTLLITLAVEIPYVFIVMRYKSIRNIACINIFTHVSYAFTLWGLHELLFLFYDILISSMLAYEIDVETEMLIITALFELFLIPLAEIWFYLRTNVYGLNNRKIVIHTCIANFLSFVAGAFITVLNF